MFINLFSSEKNQFILNNDFNQYQLMLGGNLKCLK